MPPPKMFLIRAFAINAECEDFINATWPEYEPVSISDTNAYITVLLRRRVEDESKRLRSSDKASAAARARWGNKVPKRPSANPHKPRLINGVDVRDLARNTPKANPPGERDADSAE